MHLLTGRGFGLETVFGDGFEMETRASAALCSALCESAPDETSTTAASEGELYVAELPMRTSKRFDLDKR